MRIHRRWNHLFSILLGISATGGLTGCDGLIEDASVERGLDDPEGQTDPGVPAPVFTLVPEGEALPLGYRGMNQPELGRAIRDVTGVEADLSGLYPDLETGYLRNHAARLTFLDGNEMRAMLEIASEVAAEADLAAVFPCAASACTSEEIRSYLERAFVERLDDDALAPYLDVVARAQAANVDVRRALIQVSLLSPRFLYRTELGEDGTLTAIELAEKLAFFAWGRPPDAQLRELAFDGSLATPEVYEAEVARLLADNRARDRIVEFIFDWLGLDDYDLQAYSNGVELSEEVEASMVGEVRRLIARELFYENNGLRSLLTTDTTYADANVAAIYGIEGVGEEFEVVSLAGTTRRGLLTTPLVLSAHAKETNSRSPIQRGKFVISEMLCLDFPPELGTVAAQLPPNPEGMSFREQFAEVATTAPCQNCHRMLNAGFGLDLYDNIGRRYAESFVPSADAWGILDAPPYDTIDFASPGEFMDKLATHPLLTRCAVGQAYRFAQGQYSTAIDADAIAAFEQRFNETGGDVLALFHQIATSDRFRQSATASE